MPSYAEREDVKKILSPENLEKMRAARVSLGSKTVGELSVGELTSLLKAQEPEEAKAAAKVKVKKVKDPDDPKREVSAGLQTWTTLIAETLEEMKAAGWTHPETGKPASHKDAMKAAAAKKAEEAAEAAAAAPAPKAQEPEGWIRKTISGKKYLWNPSNNHCYRLEADGSQGDWAGLYDPKNKKIDDSVEEPLEFEEE